MKEVFAMEKTKLGLPVNVAAAAAFLLFLLCGSVVGFLFLGYVLLCETDPGLKRKTVSAAIVYVGFALLIEFISVILNARSFLVGFVELCDGRLDIYVVYEICSLLNTAVYLARDIFMLLFAYRAFKNKDVELGFVKKLLDQF